MSEDNSKTVEELIELARSPGRGQIRTEKPTDTHRFIVKYNIAPGPSFVPCIVIYARYLEWCEQRRSKPISKINFFRDFSKVYEAVHRPYLISKDERGYLLDGEPFNLTLEYFQKQRQRKQRDKEKKATKKQSGSASSRSSLQPKE